MTATDTARSGLSLPLIGFGTYSLNGTAGAQAVRGAIRAGYRLIDSAYNYENEGAVGWAVRSSGVGREEVIVTSKLPGRHHAYDDALTTIQESIYRTGLDYLDLYLIHWPNPLEDRYVEAWRALIQARERGLLKAIGVSNFLPEHLDRLQRETGVQPDVNQIELHPYWPQTELLADHAERGIRTESWSPLGRGTALLEEPVLAQIGQSHGATPAQVVLAWHVARGAIPLPKAGSVHRQQENLAALDLRLSPGDVDRITQLGRPDGRVSGADPAVHQEF